MSTAIALIKDGELFNRKHYQEGMTDTEFLDKVVGSFEHDIKTDITVLKKQGYRQPCSLCGGTGY